MIGRRVDADPNKPDVIMPILQPGEYGKDLDGLWHCCAPPDTGDFMTNFHGCFGDGSGVRGHTVTEHEDGTITVSPSILITTHLGSWHGYLKHGVWEEC